VAFSATFMPKTSSSIDKIRAELAWVNVTPDKNEETTHSSQSRKGGKYLMKMVNEHMEARLNYW
jgi:hypothetical protein